jgi:protein SCO1/2
LVDAPGSPDYVIEHSSFIYLVDESGTYIGFVPTGTTADRMIEMIRRHLPEGPKK